VEGHKGFLVFAAPENSATVLSFQGRIHFYECNDLDAVLFPIRVAKELGVETLIVTNAAGGVNSDFLPGDLMMISDQINLTMESISGHGASVRNDRAAVGYDAGLISFAGNIAATLGIPLRTGVYAGVKGPSYETAAEVQMVKRLGGDAVGMSTVLEVELASSLGLRVLGISCITNKATGIGSEPLSHEEVTIVAARVRERFALLLSSLLSSLSTQ
jgi:purine-nucleoside phosphorylase